MKLFIGLVRGYYYPSRIAGLNRVQAMGNAVHLAFKCLGDQ